MQGAKHPRLDPVGLGATKAGIVASPSQGTNVLIPVRRFATLCILWSLEDCMRGGEDRPRITLPF